jgi:hypothetical protein
MEAIDTCNKLFLWNLVETREKMKERERERERE